MKQTKAIKKESYSVYIIESSNCDYDEYDELTIIATDEESAKKQSAYYFERWQYPLRAKRICGCDATAPKILTVSYCAG